MADPKDNVYHVFPQDEHHVCILRCWCGPTAEAVKKNGEVVGYLVVHNSANGREFIERGEIQ